jgi:hypothetical protein
MAKIRCPGCLKSFDISAWGQHIALSRQPTCHAIFEKNRAYLLGAGYSSDDDDDFDDPDHNMSPQEFAGDFFGSNYAEDELPGWGQTDDEEPHWAGNTPSSSDLDFESDSDSESDSAESGLTSGDDSPPIPDPMDDERGRPLSAEEVQQRSEDVWVNPFVQDFPGQAGEPIDENARKSGFEGYQTNLGDAATHNIFVPFQSHMDWEFAKWSKLRGPSSTATTELLGIENVDKF